MTIIKEPLSSADDIVSYIKEISEDYVDYHVIGLDKLYAAEKNHFWFICRRELILDTFSRYVFPESRILEVGAGTGYVARGFMERGYKVAIGEIHLSGLYYAKKYGVSECYQFDLFDPPFENEFDAIGMFDVLEHLEDDVFALQQVTKMLKPGGKLFITVPAHKWLWNRDDRIAAHKRRYSKKALIQIIKQSDMRVIEARFFFITILPLLFLRHLFKKDNGETVTEKEMNADIFIDPNINYLLLILTRLENYLLRWLPNFAGGSLLCVAEKK